MKSLEEFMKENSKNIKQEKEFADAIKADKINEYFSTHKVDATKDELLAYLKKASKGGYAPSDENLEKARNVSENKKQGWISSFLRIFKGK